MRLQDHAISLAFGILVGGGVTLGLAVSMASAECDDPRLCCNWDSFCGEVMCNAASGTSEWCSCCTCADSTGLSTTHLCLALDPQHGCTHKCP